MQIGVLGYPDATSAGAQADMQVPSFGPGRAETSCFGTSRADAALVFEFFHNACYIPNFCSKKYYFNFFSSLLYVTLDLFSLVAN